MPSPSSSGSGTRRPGGSPATAPSAPSALTGRDFLILLAATLLAFCNFAPLLSVLPLWSAGSGTGHGGVGGIAGTMMATTVGVQFLMPWILSRFGLRPILAAGALLLGTPTLAYVASPDLTWVLTVSAVRGAGFGMVVVAGSALVAELVPAAQRGRAAGLYGMAVGLPHVLMLPLGVWYVQNVGFGAVFVITALLGVLVVPLMAMMSGPRATVHGDPAGSGRPSSRTLRPLAAPWAVLLGTACAMGGVTSFLALALGDSGAAPVALLLLSLGVILGRWGAGVCTDRIGEGRLMLPGLAASALGMVGLAAATEIDTGAGVLAAGAAVLYGTSFGAVQNDTLVTMFHRAGPGGGGTASTVWNVGYDAGTGIGSVVVGVLAAEVGIAGSFTVTALAMLVITPLVWAAPRRAGTAGGRRSGAPSPGAL
ncbi:MFS transporter [Allosalinactinospora lopnorensis]|uniref:MFS transporter n=1 Tax=Allosalinactinospora lopnorensis TaxID=1352348 RepID=UPI000623C421|nr:MFS transporter [Allosalinactinospora lopnorensis]